jgi:acyl carrier protein
MIPEKIQQAFEQVFENKTIKIDHSTSPNNLSGWNSLKHVLLINEIEKLYNIQFTLDEMIEMQNVGDIVACVNSKFK